MAVPTACDEYTVDVVSPCPVEMPEVGALLGSAGEVRALPGPVDENSVARGPVDENSVARGPVDENSVAPGPVGDEVLIPPEWCAPDPASCAPDPVRGARPSRRRVAAVTVTLAAVVAAGFALARWQTRDERSLEGDARGRETMVRLARAATMDPAFVPSPRGCPSHGAEVVRCGHVPGEVQGVARQAQDALSRISTRPARLKCTPEPPRVPGAGSPLQECTVHVSDGRHGVIVFVGTDSARSVGQPGARGSALTVEAF